MSQTTTPSPTSIEVHLVGGPDDWHGATLTHVSAEELDGPREALDAYLISSHVPEDHPAPAALANYGPNLDTGWSARMWFFRGWTPPGPSDPEHRRAEHHQGVDVEVDSEGLVASWITDDGTRHRVDRVLVHQEASGEDDLAPGTWHVRSVAGEEWELLAHPGHWEAGMLPAMELSEDD